MLKVLLANNAFFSIMMMATRNEATKNTCIRALTTIYCGVRDKLKFEMLNSNNTLRI